MSDKPKKSFLASLWDDVIRPWGEAILFAWAITTFLVSMVGVDGNSMLPNLRWGERVIIPKYETWLHRMGYGNFKRGDILVVKPPPGTPNSEISFMGLWTYRPFFIKRLVGLPGDKVRVDKGEVFVNGEKVNQAGITDFWQNQQCWDTDTIEANNAVALQNENHESTKVAQELTIPEGHYFVMGDNRSPGGSEDSRIMGPVPLKDIAGRAALIVWPVTRKVEAKWDCGYSRSGDPKNQVQYSGDNALNWRILTRPEGFKALDK